VLVTLLQVVIATSALWEPRKEVRLGNHVEQDGARHLDMHNEATCALCSARAQSSLPTLPEPALQGTHEVVVIAARQYDTPALTESSPLRSRAPPFLPG
jgi:hypothetical protein